MKHLFIVVILCCAGVSTGQIWLEDFDGSNGTAGLSTSLQCGGNPDLFHFGVVCLNGGGCGRELHPAFNAVYNNVMGNFLAAFDTDNENGCGPVTDDDEFANWTGIDISSCSGSDELFLCFDVASFAINVPNAGWGTSGIVTFSVSIDGGSSIRLASIEDQGPESVPAFDLDCDLVGDPAYEIDNTFSSYCFQIPGFGSTLDINLVIDGQNEQFEEVAIDNVSVYCEADDSTLPGPLLVSCGLCGADADCDGVLVFEDCDDNDASNTNVSTNDMDCDGVVTAEDCDDNDPNNTINITLDGDCDGVPTTEDCDDTDAANTNTNVNDADCDGVPTAEDCDDSDATNTINITLDGDCDGVPTTQDCDDSDPAITASNVNDADCDGVPTAEDCDDNDATNTNSNVGDADCDGVPTTEDCDDADPTVTSTNVNDADCDGVPTAEDCDDNDATNTNSNVGDGDCDGVPTTEDCDDTDPTVTSTNVNDADCDGVPTAEDCDDNDATNTN